MQAKNSILHDISSAARVTSISLLLLLLLKENLGRFLIVVVGLFVVDFSDYVNEL